MATISRTRTFLRIRQEKREMRLTYGGAQPTLLGFDGTDSDPPVWMEAVRPIEQRIEAIHTNMAKLEKLQADRVRLIFGDRERLDGAIGELEARISQDIHKSGREVKLINHAVMSKESGASEFEKKLCRNIIKTLGSRLFADTQKFREMQRSYLKLLNSTASRDEDFFGGDIEAGMRRRGGGGGGGGGGEGEHAGLISSQAQVEVELDDFALDNDEVSRIAKNIAELSGLFQELAELVTDQGTVLDRIDYNMDLSLENVTKGTEQIEKAAAAQRRNPAFKCMAILVLLIAVFAFILGLKLWMKHGGQRRRRS